jgi:hypothetical protein
MALARVKVWTPEILTATDLNTEFNNFLNYINGSAVTLTSPVLTNPVIVGNITGSVNLGPSLAGLLSNLVPGVPTNIPGVVATTPGGGIGSIGWIVFAGSAGNFSGACLATDTGGIMTPVIQGGTASPVQFFGSGGQLQLAHGYGANSDVSWHAIRVAF